MASQQASSTAEPGPDPKASPDYLQFPCLPPGGPLNRWSRRITKDHDFPGAQVRRTCLNLDTHIR
jgi:dihydroxy-acid dehydratase